MFKTPAQRIAFFSAMNKKKQQGMNLPQHTPALPQAAVPPQLPNPMAPGIQQNAVPQLPSALGKIAPMAPVAPPMAGPPKLKFGHLKNLLGKKK